LVAAAAGSVATTLAQSAALAMPTIRVIFFDTGVPSFFILLREPEQSPGVTLG
jgi:hypothetical protein